MTGGLFKTTVVIWTRGDPTHRMELSTLAREAEVGQAYCSRYRAEWVADPTTDPAWDGTEFFDDPDPAGGDWSGSVESAAATGELVDARQREHRRLHLTLEDLDDLRDGAGINVPYADGMGEAVLRGNEDLTADQLDQLAAGGQVLVALAGGEVLVTADPPARHERPLPHRGRRS